MRQTVASQHGAWIIEANVSSKRGQEISVSCEIIVKTTLTEDG